MAKASHTVTPDLHEDREDLSADMSSISSPKAMSALRMWAGSKAGWYIAEGQPFMVAAASQSSRRTQRDTSLLLSLTLPASRLPCPGVGVTLGPSPQCPTLQIQLLWKSPTSTLPVPKSGF